MKTKNIIDGTIDVAAATTKLVGSFAIGRVAGNVAAACLPPAVSTPAKIIKTVGVYGGALGISYGFDRYVDDVSEILHTAVNAVHEAVSKNEEKDSSVDVMLINQSN